jgi:hypothetical protein
MDERRVLAAINRGVTLVHNPTSQESPAKELLDLANALYDLCEGADKADS